MKFYPSITNSGKAELDPLYRNVLSWNVQEKIDGMNTSVVIDPSAQDYELRGRTSNATIKFDGVKLPAFKDALNALDLKDDYMMILFGEQCGGGIQKKWYFETPEFVLFDVVLSTPNHEFYLDQDAVLGIAETLGIRSVPILGTSLGVVNSLHQLHEFGVKSQLNPDVDSEGVVLKPVVEMKDKFGQRVIYKSCYRYFV